MHLLVTCLPPEGSTRPLRPLQRTLHHPLCPLPFVLLHPWHQFHLPDVALLVWSLLVRRRSSPQPHYASPLAGPRRSSTFPAECVCPSCDVPLCKMCCE